MENSQRRFCICLERQKGGEVTVVLFCKFMGAICVMSATGYLALNINQMMELRSRELRKLYSILLQLKSEIQYMANTLPECFRNLSKGAKEPFTGWLTGLCDSMEKEEAVYWVSGDLAVAKEDFTDGKKNKKESAGFAEIWQEQLEDLYQHSALEKEDLEPLYELADKLGMVDMTAQLKAIDYVLLHIEKNRTTLEGELGQKKKVVATLGMFWGFMTLILLL